MLLIWHSWRCLICLCPTLILTQNRYICRTLQNIYFLLSILYILRYLICCYHNYVIVVASLIYLDIIDMCEYIWYTRCLIGIFGFFGSIYCQSEALMVSWNHSNNMFFLKNLILLVIFFRFPLFHLCLSICWKGKYLMCCTYQCICPTCKGGVEITPAPFRANIWRVGNNSSSVSS